MRARAVVDVSGLPEHAFGSRAPIWWGTIGLMAIEGTMFALAAATDLYLRLRAPAWPPSGEPGPSVPWGTISIAVLLASIIPNLWADRRARRPGGEGAIRAALIVAVLFGLAALVLRGVELSALHVRWDESAYGSIVWSIMGLHMGEMLAGTLETIVLVVFMFRYPLDEKHRVDVTVDTLFWYFVVAVWVPMYLIIYWLPRWVS